MKVLISMLKSLLLFIIQILLLADVGILSISMIIPNFITKANLVIPSQLSSFINPQIIINNLYDYRFKYLLLFVLSILLLTILTISRSTRKSAFMLSVPFMIYGYIFLYAKSLSNVITADYTADQLYAFQQSSEKLFLYTMNLGIKYLIIGGVLFLLFVVLVLQYLKAAYNDRNNNKIVEK